MNEASSKYVDNLALQRLLGDKISKVSHSPNHSWFVPEENLFLRLGKDRLDFSAVCRKEDKEYGWFEIPSFETSPYYPENNVIYLYEYPTAVPEGNILFLHGLFDDNMFNYGYLFRMLNDLNLNVFYMVLPYHYQRKPAASLFGGEYFFSADLFRTQNAFKQAVYDLEASLQWIQHQNTLPVVLAGFSMGGAVCFRYFQLTNYVIGTFLINPVTDLTNIIWDNPLLLTVGRDLQNSGFDLKRSEAIFKQLDPCEHIDQSLNEQKIAMVYSQYDQIIGESKNKRFIERTGIQNVQAYHSGHLNILRVPKLALDIQGFYRQIN